MSKSKIKNKIILALAFAFLPFAASGQDTVGTDTSLSVNAQVEYSSDGPVVKLSWSTKNISTFGYIVQEGFGEDQTDLAVIEAPEVGQLSKGGVFVDGDVEYGQTYNYQIVPFDNGGVYPSTSVVVEILPEDACSNSDSHQGIFYFDPTKSSTPTAE
jgi:hypothetical protein